MAAAYGTAKSTTISLTCAPPEINEFGLIDKLKFFNTALTGLIIVSTYFYYRYEANIFAIRTHTEFMDKQLRSYWLYQCGLLKWFLLESVLMCVHQVPTYYQDIIVQTSYFSSRPSVYSVDGLIALFMIVRMWQVWKWYKGKLYTRYASRRYGIRLSDEETGSLLAIRLSVLQKPIQAAVYLMILVALFGSFVYRIAESSTNEAVGVDYWDCIWFMIDAMTGIFSSHFVSLLFHIPLLPASSGFLGDFRK